MTKTIKNNKHFINDIPSNWFSSKLKYLMTILPKSDIPAGLGKEEGIYPFYTSSQLLTKRIDTCLYEGNSITMGTGGLASINYVDVPFATSTDCFNFTCGEMTKFIYYYLYSLLDVISNLGFEGMGLKHLQKDFIENLEIFFPSIEEQQKIVSFLDNQIVNINKLITETKKSIKLYEEYKESLITETIENNSYLNTQTKIKNVLLKIGDGTHATFNRTSSGKMLLSAKNVFENGLKFSDNESLVSIEDYEKIISNGFPQKNDVLLCCVGTIGRVMLYDLEERYAFQRSIAFLRPNQNVILPKMLFYCLRTKNVLSQERKMVKKSAQDGLYQGTIKLIEITFPNDLNAQQEIINFLDKKLEEIDSLIEKKEIFINQLEEYKKSLIYEYVTGKKQLN